MAGETDARGAEERLIVALAKSRLTASALDVLDASGVDTGRFISVARSHGVLPIVRRALHDAVVPGLGPDTRAAVDEAADGAARRSLQMTAALLDLLGTLAAAGVPTLAWKGPVLAEMLWSDVAARQYSDLDLLVRRTDIPRARDVLLAEGFRPSVTREPWQHARYVERVGVVELVRDRDALPVEVHWTVVPTYFSSAMQPDGIWERVQDARVARHVVPTLAVEDLLIALSIHGFKHRWERLGWIVDIARLLDVRRDIDWAVLAARTRRDGSQRLLQIAIGLTTELFGLSPPVAAAQLSLGNDATARRIIAKIAPGVLGRLPDGRFAPISAMDMAARERRIDRVLYLIRALTTPTRGDWEALPLPPRLRAVHRVVRPIRLLWVYARGRRGDA
jgi:Uncharacterised nucleotidyltransferase